MVALFELFNPNPSHVAISSKIMCSQAQSDHGAGRDGFETRPHDRTFKWCPSLKTTGSKCPEPEPIVSLAYTAAMSTDLTLMYDWTRRTREHLFAFLETLPVDVFTLEHPDFAYGSIRNIHAHVAFGYLVWVGVVGLGLERAKLELAPTRIPDVQAMRERFKTVDGIVAEALEQFHTPDEMFERDVRGSRLQLTQRWLLVRPLTHEFHHKGQLLALARILGHPLPEDMGTDLVGPFEDA